MFRNNRKAELLEFCSIASSLNIEIDPNGLIEDRDDVLNTNSKTKTKNIPIPSCSKVLMTFPSVHHFYF